MLRFLPLLFISSFSAQVLVGPCTDVGDVDFGDCDMVLGIAVVNGGCTYLSGCGWEVCGVDYSPAFMIVSMNVTLAVLKVFVSM